MNRLILALLTLGLLTGCDQISERAGFPDPAKKAAEGKAIGGACRHAGRGLEDCYALNPTASKSAVFEGWKEMNEYMAKNQMQAVPPEINLKAKIKSRKGDEDGEEGARADKGQEEVADAARTPARSGHGETDGSKEPDKSGHKEVATH